MKKTTVPDQLMELLDVPIMVAAANLRKGRNQSKMCKYTIPIGSTDITMIVRRPPLSDCLNKSLVFEITIWVKRFVHGVHRRLMRITDVYQIERVFPTMPLLLGLPRC